MTLDLSDNLRIRFILRAHDGRIIASATSNPIKITDDHKTETKGNPRAGVGKATPAKPPARPRKGRNSAASSRLQSPVPSEGESVQSASEAGAVFQKQTPQVRAGKPYERPAPPPPPRPPWTDPYWNGLQLVGDYGASPADPAADFFRYRQSSSIHSSTSMSQPMMDRIPNHASPFAPAGNPSFGPRMHFYGAVSPQTPQRPDFSGFTSMSASASIPSSGLHSASSSNVVSPMSRLMPLGDEDTRRMVPNALLPSELDQAFHMAAMHEPDLWESMMPTLSPEGGQREVANNLANGFDGAFDTSSHGSFPSSTSALSNGMPSGSLSSNSGLLPDSLENFLDYSGGNEQNSFQPSFLTDSPNSFPVGNDLSLGLQIRSDEQISETLPAMQPPAPGPPLHAVDSFSGFPVIMDLFPPEGPISGGTKVCIPGGPFAPDTTILFGGHIATVETNASNFIVVVSPPACLEGYVAVTIQGVPTTSNAPSKYFRYTPMDTEACVYVRSSLSAC